MRSLVWGSSFARAFKRITRGNPDVTSRVRDVLRLLSEDPFSPKLRTHKLKGRLSDSWACWIDYEYRIVFDFATNPDADEEEILLADVGTHDEVCRVTESWQVSAELSRNAESAEGCGRGVVRGTWGSAGGGDAGAASGCSAGGHGRVVAE